MKQAATALIEPQTGGAARPLLSPRPSPLKDFSLSRDVAAFHAIFHHPSVAPFVTQAGDDVRDLTDFFDNGENLGFLFNGCAFLAHHHEPHVYEVHSAALPSARGAYVAEAAELAIRCMFLGTPATELLTRVVEGNAAASALAAKVGFILDFERPGAWLAENGLRGVRFYGMRYPDWIRRQDWLEASGAWFHELLGEDQTHGHDAAHDRHVGAAVEMALSAQPEKACALYNRWARFAGYQPIELVGIDPVTINIVSHLVTIADGKIEVLQCQ